MLLRFAGWVSSGVLGLDPESRFGAAVEFFLYDTIKIFLLLAVMIFVIGILRTFLPEKKLRDWMTRGGCSGNVIAALFGAVTPFCSCSSIPIFIGFLKAGVPLGICFSFLITSPIINEYLVVLMASEFGVPITLGYVVAGLLMGIFAGIFLGRLRLERFIEKDFAGEDDFEGERPTTWGGRIFYGWREVVSILRSIWVWVLLGVGVGAFLHNYVPRELIHEWMGATGVFSVPIATALGVPLYGSCAAIVPIAVVLFEKGIPMGTALAFMMGMAALSLPEAVMMRRVVKLPLIAIFFGTTAAAIVVTGYFLNGLSRLLGL